MSVNDPEGFENFVKMFGIELDDECRDYMEQVNKNKSLENQMREQKRPDAGTFEKMVEDPMFKVMTDMFRKQM